jgi:hypothetical protein
MDAPDQVKPRTSTARVTGQTWNMTVPGLTIETIDIPMP